MQVEIEIDTGRNGDVMFLPIGKTVRGRFDYRNCKEPLARTKDVGPFPGQRVRIDTEKSEGSILEPLHDEPILSDQLRRKGLGLPPKEQRFRAHGPTWLYWMKRAVEAGAARLTSGKFPDKIEGARIDLHRPNQDASRERLIEQLITVAYAHLPEKAKREVAESLALV